MKSFHGYGAPARAQAYGSWERKVLLLEDVHMTEQAQNALLSIGRTSRLYGVSPAKAGDSCWKPSSPVTIIASLPMEIQRHSGGASAGMLRELLSAARDASEAKGRWRLWLESEQNPGHRECSRCWSLGREGSCRPCPLAALRKDLGHIARWRPWLFRSPIFVGGRKRPGFPPLVR